MGCLHTKLTDEERAAIKKSKKWDKDLEKKNNADARIIRVLLLGTGESGKSTILKQMRILYNKNGFTNIERETFKVVMRRNVVECMQTLLEGIEVLYGNDEDLELSDLMDKFFEEEEAKEAANYILDVEAHDIDMWQEDIVKHVQYLWKHKIVQQSFENRSKLQLLDSTPYLCENVGRIGSEDFDPDKEDILRARLRTTGIVEEDVIIKEVPFQFLDVGGQRNERRKWIHCFSDVKAVIFVASLSEYDQVLYEDDDQNRLQEALDVFEKIINNASFATVSFILFLNKVDLFQEKLKSVKFKTYFKKFEGDETKVQDTAGHIEQLFLDRCKEAKDIYTHITCATDTENVKRVFEVCKLRILEDNLAGVGLR